MVRGTVWILALVLAGAVATTLFLALRTTPPLESAVGNLRRDSLFSTSRKAAESFVAVGERLRATGRRCIRDESRDDPRCSALLAAAGYMEIAALRVVECTRPAVFEARRTTIDHLLDLQAFVEAGSRGRLPEPPPLPRC